MKRSVDAFSRAGKKPHFVGSAAFCDYKLANEDGLGLRAPHFVGRIYYSAIMEGERRAGVAMYISRTFLLSPRPDQNRPV
jgi:hypothetical protein